MATMISQTKSVIIVGGGISGLSCAFDLHKKFNVMIMESDVQCGGQSRSINNDNVHMCYSWRIFTTKYKNLLHLLSRMPTESGHCINKNFVEALGYKTGSVDETFISILGIPLWEASSALNAEERRRIVSKLVTLLSMCKERLAQYDDTTFFEFMKPRGEAAEKYIDHITGPYLGLEARRASVYCVCTMLQVVYANAYGLLPTAPFQEAIFDPWVRYLKRKGVDVRTGVTVSEVTKNSVTTSDGTRYAADYIVLCVDHNALCKINRRSLDLKIENIEKFATSVQQVYFSFELLIPNEVEFPYSVFTVKEAAWLPIVERWNKFWKDDQIPVGFAEQWNVAILDGLSYKGRVMTECNTDEIVAFAMEQMKESRMLGGIRLKNGQSFWDSQSFEIRIWPYWRFKRAKTDEHASSVQNFIQPRLLQTRSFNDHKFANCAHRLSDCKTLSDRLAGGCLSQRSCRCNGNLSKRRNRYGTTVRSRTPAASASGKVRRSYSISIGYGCNRVQ